MRSCAKFGHRPGSPADWKCLQRLRFGASERLDRTHEVVGWNVAHEPLTSDSAEGGARAAVFRDHVDVPLLVDTASAVRRLAPDVFGRWAATRTVFQLSEMRELGDLRQTVSRALGDAGFSVVVLAAIRERLDLEGRFVNAWIERTLL
jgi:hypothetical protein